MERSALTQSGLKKVFDEAIRCGMQNDGTNSSNGRKKKKKCTIL
jgi:hypothetical protein